MFQPHAGFCLGFGGLLAPDHLSPGHPNLSARPGLPHPLSAPSGGLSKQINQKHTHTHTATHGAHRIWKWRPCQSVATWGFRSWPLATGPLTTGAQLTFETGARFGLFASGHGQFGYLNHCFRFVWVFNFICLSNYAFRLPFRAKAICFGLIRHLTNPGKRCEYPCALSVGN